MRRCRQSRLRSLTSRRWHWRALPLTRTRSLGSSTKHSPPNAPRPSLTRARPREPSRKGGAAPSNGSSARPPLRRARAQLETRWRGRFESPKLSRRLAHGTRLSSSSGASPSMPISVTGAPEEQIRPRRKTCCARVSPPSAPPCQTAKRRCGPSRGRRRLRGACVQGTARAKMSPPCTGRPRPKPRPRRRPRPRRGRRWKRRT
mmetsp:Transcript_66876/g.151086  ORF Transcript_66876/g.151086 Transcript_66876/m.151086 type:complete len:203 (+) Transcript_66876:313-921(+)